MKIGYSRVAAVSRQPKLQHNALESYGCQRFYADIRANGGEEQPELDRLLGHVRPGDTLVVNQLDQLSDSMRTLFKVFEILRTKNVALVALEDGVDTSVPDGWEALREIDQMVDEQGFISRNRKNLHLAGERLWLCKNRELQNRSSGT